MSVKITGLAGVVILYNPTEEVFSNIITYANALEKLWVIDNTEYNLQDCSCHFKEFSNIEIIQDSNNKGIGSRINQAIEKALSEKYEWLLTMDQDSSFTESNLDTYTTLISGVDTSQNIALIGIRYTYEKKDPDKNIFLEKEINLITSGTFINLRAIHEIGFMNDDLFIDEVDSDFVYRAIIGGWQVLVCNGIYLKHELGERIVVKSFATGKIYNRKIHSPVRLYYITRNFLWVRKKYKFYFPEIFKIRRKQIFNVYKNSLLFGKHRIFALYMICKGYLDFKKNKLGKLIGNS